MPFIYFTLVANAQKNVVLDRNTWLGILLNNDEKSITSSTRDVILTKANYRQAITSSATKDISKEFNKMGNRMRMIVLLLCYIMPSNMQKLGMPPHIRNRHERSQEGNDESS